MPWTQVWGPLGVPFRPLHVRRNRRIRFRQACYIRQTRGIQFAYGGGNVTIMFMCMFGVMRPQASLVLWKISSRAAAQCPGQLDEVEHRHMAWLPLGTSYNQPYVRSQFWKHRMGLGVNAPSIDYFFEKGFTGQGHAETNLDNQRDAPGQDAGRSQGHLSSNLLPLILSIVSAKMLSSTVICM
jgi:hypothetical protein